MQDKWLKTAEKDTYLLFNEGNFPIAFIYQWSFSDNWSVKIIETDFETKASNDIHVRIQIPQINNSFSSKEEAMQEVEKHVHFTVTF